MVSIRNLDKELKCKQICRFCLTTMRPLTNIYSTENQNKYGVPLSLQIVSVSSIEVFSSDKLPSSICDLCNGIMDFCYKFKQMCKDADSKLQLFRNSGIWPDALAVPEFPLDPNVLTENDLIFEEDEPIEVVIPQEVEEIIPEAPTIVRSPPKLRKMQEIHPARSPPPPEEPVIETEVIERPTRKKPKVLNQITVTRKSLDGDEDLKIKRNKFGNVDILMDPLEVIPTDVFSCQFCSRTFPLKQLLEIHERNHTRERDHECDSCSKKFFTKYDLAKHTLTHTGERPFQCVICGKSFSRSTLLYRHERIHSNVPRFNCDACDRFFFREEDLEEHAKKHSKSRPFQCNQCPKSFAFKQGLERHEDLHTNQPHSCEYCSKTFSSRNHLLRHVKAHAGDRPYPCKYCPNTFLLSHHLTRHLRSHAGVENNVLSFKCHRCDETRSTPRALVQHLMQHGPTKDNRCPLCKEQFRTEKETRFHIQKHEKNWQFACEFCDLMYLDEEGLMRHCQAEHASEQELYTADLAKNAKRFEVQSEQAENQKEFIEIDIDIIKANPAGDTAASSRLGIKRPDTVLDEKSVENKGRIFKGLTLRPLRDIQKTFANKAAPVASSSDAKPVGVTTTRTVVVRRAVNKK